MTVVQRGLCIAPDDTSLEPSPTWVSLYDYHDDGLRVQQVQVDGGRQSELDKMGSITLTATIFDDAGILDTTNPDGPFYGNLNPRKQVAFFLTNPIASGHPESCRFRGFLESIHTSVDVSEGFMVHTLTASGALTIFSTAEVIPDDAGDTVPPESIGDVFYEDGPVNVRILAGLADAGWPSERTIVFSGNVNIQETVYAPRTVILTVLQDAADAEFPAVAVLFEDKDGNVVFHGRYPRFNPSEADFNIGRWKAGDWAALQAATNTNIAPIAGLEYQRDVADMLNAVLAYPANIAPQDIAGQLVKDATSISEFGVLSTGFDDLLTESGEEMSPLDGNDETKQFATYYVNNRKQPHNKITQLRFITPRDSHPNLHAWWALICGVDLNDLIHVETSHPGGGGFDEGVFVEGRHETYTPMRDEYPQIVVELDTSPQAYFANTYPDGPA